MICLSITGIKIFPVIFYIPLSVQPFFAQKAMFLLGTRVIFPVDSSFFLFSTITTCRHLHFKVLLSLPSFQTMIERMEEKKINLHLIVDTNCRLRCLSFLPFSSPLTHMLYNKLLLLGACEPL